MVQSALLKSNITQARQLDWRRLIFVASVTFYGGALGVAVVIINILSRIPIWREPERLDTDTGAFVYGGGALAGILLGALVAYWSHSEGHRWSLGILWWWALGIGYGIGYSILMGGILMPFSLMLNDFYQGLLSPIEVTNALADIILGSIGRALVSSSLLLGIGLVAGLLFGTGAWIIDRLHTSVHPWSARYGAWATALFLGVVVLIVVSLAPPSLLARLG